MKSFDYQTHLGCLMFRSWLYGASNIGIGPEYRTCKIFGSWDSRLSWPFNFLVLKKVKKFLSLLDTFFLYCKNSKFPIICPEISLKKIRLGHFHQLVNLFSLSKRERLTGSLTMSKSRIDLFIAWTRSINDFSMILWNKFKFAANLLFLLI